jgi:hypothetical protein|tara:strand:+ start:81 stop:239 length:159 start_codon:yes stop_codon:yes gene_type:complete
VAFKKQNFAEGEIVIFDEACVYKPGDYWQFCKEFSFTAGMLKGSLNEGRRKS